MNAKQARQNTDYCRDPENIAYLLPPIWAKIKESGDNEESSIVLEEVNLPYLGLEKKQNVLKYLQQEGYTVKINKGMINLVVRVKDMTVISW